MRNFLKLIRVKHYIKNILIFAVIVFSGQISVPGKLLDTFIAFVAFCLMTSVIYIINDIKDKDKDRLHPKKCKRPIASGAVSVKAAIITAIFCFLLGSVLFAFVFEILALIMLAIYLIINLLYSFGLKKIPLVDVSILVAGFVLRVIYGAVITGIEVSNWLYLTVIAFSFFMAFGKRRNELKQNSSSNTRDVLKEYSFGFLDKSMYMCLAIGITFYALWAMSNTENGHYSNLIILSVPIVILISLKYCLNIEKDSSDGDPTEILFNDVALVLLCIGFSVFMFIILYLDTIKALLIR